MASVSSKSSKRKLNLFLVMFTPSIPRFYLESISREILLVFLLVFLYH